jgi:hypothetical protein
MVNTQQRADALVDAMSRAGINNFFAMAAMVDALPPDEFLDAMSGFLKIAKDGEIATPE